MPKTDTEAMQAFLTGLLAPLPADSCIEIRHKKNGDKKAASDWVTSIAALRALAWPVEEHVWFGVALRARDKQDGAHTGLTWATCVWADFDRVEDKDGLVGALVAGKGLYPATYVVDSGGGIHAYWRLDRLLDLRQPAQVGVLREIVHGVARHLQADPTVHDPTRVMGLPGTWNIGNGKTKVYDPARSVHVVFGDARRTYRVDELSRFRRPVESAEKSRVSVAPAAGVAGVAPETLRIPPRLQKLVASGWVDGCGYTGRSELDQGMMVAMLNGEHTDDEIYAVFKQPAWGIGAKYRDKGADGDRYLEVTLAAAKRWTTANTVHAAPVGTIRDVDGRMEIRREKGWTTICNRVLKPVARLTGDVGGFRVAVSGEGDPEHDSITLNTHAFATNVAFKQALNQTGAAWLGTDVDVQHLLPYFEEQKPPVMRAVNKIGWHGGRVVFPNAQLIDGALEENSDYLYLGKISGARLVEAVDWSVLCASVVGLVPKLHTPGAMLPIMGWFAAAFAAPMVRKYSGGAFPLLMVFGTPEAGKTTILEIMQRLSGRDSTLQSSTLTLFANIELLAGSNSLPVVLDEHRANNTGRYRTNLYPVLREAYNGGVMSRGKPDLSVARYELSAPVALGGETPFRDPALVDRTIHVKLERADKNPEALASTLALPLDQYAVGMYRHVATAANIALWETAGRLLPAEFRDSAHERQRIAWQTAAFGLLLLGDHFDAPAAIAQFNDYRREPETDVVQPTMAVVYEAVRVIAELIKSHRMRDNQEFSIRDGALWFIPGLVLPMIEEYFQRIDTDLPMGREAILGRMREESKTDNPLVTEYQRTFRVGPRVAKGIALSLERIEQDMGIPTTYWTQMATEVAL